MKNVHLRFLSLLDLLERYHNGIGGARHHHCLESIYALMDFL